MTSNALVLRTLSIWFLTYNYVDTIFVHFFAPISCSHIQLSVVECKDADRQIHIVCRFIHSHLWIFCSLPPALSERYTHTAADRHIMERECECTRSVAAMNKCIMMNTARLSAKWKICPTRSTYAVVLVSFFRCDFFRWKAALIRVQCIQCVKLWR